MKQMTTSPTGRAIIFLASRCNGATSEDGAGFSKFDARTGHDLAEKLVRFENFASEKQLAFAQKICNKYRRQLDEGGFSLAEIKAEVFEAVERAPRAAPADGVILAAIVSHSQSGKAIRIAQGGRCTWVPVSQIKNRAPTETFGVFAFTLPAWVIADKGLVA
jgi:hypothetical protein